MTGQPTIHSASRDRGEHADTIVCSPHYDDAVLNCWSVLERDERCSVVNVFTGAPAGEFATWYDRLNGASTSASHMRQRALEDSAALAVTGRTAIDLGMFEAQYRLRRSPALHALFRHAPPLRFVMQRLPFLRPMLYATPAPQAEEIARALVQAAPRASRLCVPAGIGGHRDHLVVRQAGVLLASRGWCVRLYADLPYAMMHGWPRWIAAPEGERAKDRAGALWCRHLRDLRAELQDPIAQATVVKLTPRERERKAEALSRYASQIDSLNSGRTKGWLQNPDAFAYEVYWELPRAIIGA